MGQLNPLNSSQHWIRSPNVSMSHEQTTDGFDDCACGERWFQSIKSAADSEEVARWVLKYITVVADLYQKNQKPKQHWRQTTWPRRVWEWTIQAQIGQSLSYVPFLTSSNLHWPPNQELGIDIVCEDNKTRNHCLCSPCLHLTRWQCCSLHPAFYIAPCHFHRVQTQVHNTPSSLTSNVNKVSSTDSIYSNWCRVTFPQAMV